MASCRAAQSGVVWGERFLVLGQSLDMLSPQCKGGCFCHRESNPSTMSNYDGMSMDSTTYGPLWPQRSI